MARPPSENLTEREAQIMEILWREGSAAADQIRQGLPDNPHDSTVRTLLRILENKGYVKHVIRGKAYIYRPMVRKANAERKALGNLIKRFFGGSAEALVQRLIEDEQLTPEQLEQLRNAAGGGNPAARPFDSNVIMPEKQKTALVLRKAEPSTRRSKNEGDD